MFYNKDPLTGHLGRKGTEIFHQQPARFRDCFSRKMKIKFLDIKICQSIKYKRHFWNIEGEKQKKRYIKGPFWIKYLEDCLNIYCQKYGVNLNLRMNFSFSGVIIIDKFGFTSRRFECNAKMLATEILVDGCRHIHQLVHSKYSALPT